jgi:dihydrolipoamide dehydrogenase
MRFVIIGGGPAGNTAATHAARLGAEVTLVEKDVIGGAAHLWDCIPSKAMIATGGAMSFNRRLAGMGLTDSESVIDLDLVKLRIDEITGKLQGSIAMLLESQGVRMLKGTGRLKGPHEVIVETDEGVEELDADFVLLSTGSRPRIPDWATVDGERILTTRDAATDAVPSGRYRLRCHGG